MKKLLLLILILLFVGGGVVLFLFNQNSNNDGKDAPDSGAKFMLFKEDEGVQYKTTGDYQDLEDEQIELTSGTFIKTSDGGAQILLEDNSLISLDANTEIQINFSDTGTDLLQLAGNTWHRIEKLTSGEGYQVETPNLLAAVRGTEFGVLTPFDDQSEVFSVKSTLQVGKLKKTEDGMTDFDESFLLEPDMWFTNVKGETMLEHTPSDIISGSWYTKNQRLNLLLGDSDGDLSDVLPELLDDLDSYNQPDVQGISAVPGLQNIDLFDYAQLCESVQLDEFVIYRNSLFEAIEYIPGYSEEVMPIIEYLDHVVESCDDNELDEAELKKLNELAGAVQGDRG